MVRGDLTPLLGLAVAIPCPSHCTRVSCRMGAVREWSKPPYLAKRNQRNGVSYSSAPLTLWPKWAAVETKRQRRTEGGSESRLSLGRRKGEGCVCAFWPGVSPWGAFCAQTWHDVVFSFEKEAFTFIYLRDKLRLITWPLCVFDILR